MTRWPSGEPMSTDGHGGAGPEIAAPRQACDIHVAHFDLAQNTVYPNDFRVPISIGIA